MSDMTLEEVDRIAKREPGELLSGTPYVPVHHKNVKSLCALARQALQQEWRPISELPSLTTDHEIIGQWSLPDGASGCSFIEYEAKRNLILDDDSECWNFPGPYKRFKVIVPPPLTEGE